MGGTLICCGGGGGGGGRREGGLLLLLNDTEQIRQGRRESARHLGRRRSHSSPKSIPGSAGSAAPSHHHQPTPNPRFPQAGAALFTSGGAAAALQRLSNGPQVDPGTNRSEIRMDSTAPHWGPNHRRDSRPGSASVL